MGGIVKSNETIVSTRGISFPAPLPYSVAIQFSYRVNVFALTSTRLLYGKKIARTLRENHAVQPKFDLSVIGYGVERLRWRLLAITITTTMTATLTLTPTTRICLCGCISVCLHVGIWWWWWRGGGGKGGCRGGILNSGLNVSNASKHGTTNAKDGTLTAFRSRVAVQPHRMKFSAGLKRVREGYEIL